MVDELLVWTKRPPFHRGSCHLTTDGDDLEELHAFAVEIGLQRSWFQPHRSAPHYDLTPSRRARALVAGAVEVLARRQAIARRARRTGESFVLVPCAECGVEVPEARRCYATPVCYACLLPPHPIPILEWKP